MPAAVLYLLLWQWLQIFTRIPQTWIDGDTLSTGIWGPNVARAYWYMLASLVVLAVTFRVALARLKPPTPAQRTAHYHWQIRDLLFCTSHRRSSRRHPQSFLGWYLASHSR